jgi:hypothetical protein
LVDSGLRGATSAATIGVLNRGGDSHAELNVMTIKHIRQVATERTWCCLEIEAQWFFTSIDQATIGDGPVCKKCVTAIIKRLRSTDPPHPET